MASQNSPNRELFRVPQAFTVTAHSGSMGLPENSIEAMQAGVAAGAQIVEFDLRFLPGGQAVLSHDEPQGDCASLREAFAFLSAHPNVRANVDVKMTDYLESVEPMAREAGVLDRIFFTGISEQDVPAVRAKCPAVPYYLNADVRMWTNIDKLAQKACALGAIGINCSYESASLQLTQTFRQKGLLTSVWTIDSARKARRVLAMQPDNVTTRRPDLIASMIERGEA